MANLTTLKKRKTKKAAHIYDGAGDIFKASMKDGSGVAGILGAAGSAVSTYNNTAQVKDTSDLESQIEDRKTYVSNANSNDELLAEMAADTAIGHVNWRDLLPSAGQSAGNIIGGTLSSAASGAGAGPWGALAGAGAGLIGGIAGLFTARSKARRKANRLNKEREIANYAKASTMTQKAAALDAAMDLDKQRAYAAEGGFLPRQISTNGTDINNGITLFNNGGSHEENPYDGIPQGIAPDGLPNLVEEGEVKYNNYIYSDRLMIPKELKKKYKLKGNTYAEAMKHAQKESEERPNDPISKRGLDWIASVLMEAQEQERQARKLEGSNQLQFSKGGHLFNGKTNNWLAATPSLINAASALYSTLAPSTYNDLPLHERLERPTFVEYDSPDTQRLSYKPFDTNYYGNKLMSQANAARQAAIQTAGTNAQAARAGILAADHNAQNQLGDLFRKAEEYNLDQRQKVAAFNNALEQFDAQQRLAVSKANADIQNKWREDRLKQLVYLSQLKASEEAQRGESIGTSLTALGTSLGSLFKDIQARNAGQKKAQDEKDKLKEDIKTARQASTTGTSQAYGGYLSLTKKKKRR